jgi:Ca2+/Na+ antiporter
MAMLLLFSIIVVGNFLRDNECNYLEGALLVVSCLSYNVLSYAKTKTD